MTLQGPSKNHGICVSGFNDSISDVNQPRLLCDTLAPKQRRQEKRQKKCMGQCTPYRRENGLNGGEVHKQADFVGS